MQNGELANMKNTFLLFFLILLTGQVSPDDAGSKPATAGDAQEKPKIKIPKAKTPKTIIDEVTESELLGVLDEHEHTAVLFYSNMNQVYYSKGF